MASDHIPICYVDDEESEREQFEKHLGHCFEVGTGGSLDEARRALGRKPALVVLDLYMPTGMAPMEQGSERRRLLTAEFQRAAAKLRGALPDSRWWYRHKSHTTGFVLGVLASLFPWALVQGLGRVF